MARAYRPRRSCLAVPGSSRRFIDKARGLPCDEVFLDLEDAVAPAAKAAARGDRDRGAHAGATGAASSARSGSTTSARAWAYRDVIEVVEGAAANLDVDRAAQGHRPGARHLAGPAAHPGGAATWASRPGRIGIEAQIEDASGLAAVDAIAAASPRLEALVFGPADFMASLGMRSLEMGAQPAGYAAATPSTTRCCASWSPRAATGCRPSTARTRGSPTPAGLSRAAASVAALGFDGKWVLHPGQIDPVNAGLHPGPGRVRPGRADPGGLRVLHHGTSSAARPCWTAR